jgi:hypothetical protein
MKLDAAIFAIGIGKNCFVYGAILVMIDLALREPSVVVPDTLSLPQSAADRGAQALSLNAKGFASHSLKALVCADSY